MNHVVDYVSYGESGSNNGGDGDGDGSTNIDDDDDDGDGGGEENDSDDEGESFGMREFDRRKLVLCTTRALALYYNNYIYKEPCMVLYNTGMRWLNEILHGHWR
jgi:hypothetical protein